MKIGKYEVTGINVDASNAFFKGENVLRVEKKDKLMQFDENTYAKLEGTSFHNGSIEVEVLSRLLPNAPDFSRGFIGIVFRASEKNDQFESFYIRPTNGHTNDPVRKNRAVQYFSYPIYSFEYFRNRGITEFEGPADVALNVWTRLKIIVSGERSSLYINDSREPALTVDYMKLGKNTRGSIGLFVDIGTEGFFKNIRIMEED